MVIVENIAKGKRLVLRPNRSASWFECKWYFWLIASPCLMIALVACTLGAWPLLPFSIIELLLLFVMLRKTNKKCSRSQIIFISPKQVYIAEGARGPEVETIMERPSAYILVDEDSRPMTSMTLCMSDGIRMVPIGLFLNDEDRDLLYLYLTQAGLISCHNKWWVPHPCN